MKQNSSTSYTERVNSRHGDVYSTSSLLGRRKHVFEEEKLDTRVDGGGQTLYAHDMFNVQQPEPEDRQGQIHMVLKNTKVNLMKIEPGYLSGTA
ncbi:hypothetical protein HDE_01814 [Halotydeus destructor]|nr:hypothetical protein HDE_01814 [Halotydeus destructor]